MPQAVHEKFRENLNTRLSEASYSADPLSSQFKRHVPRVRSIMIAPKNAVRSGLEKSVTLYLRSADDSFGERIRHFPARQELKSRRKKHARPHLLHFARSFQVTGLTIRRTSDKRHRGKNSGALTGRLWLGARRASRQ
jgi:hypothetical protein